MDHQSLLDHLRQRLGLAALPMDADGSHRLEFDGMPVRCFRVGPFLYLEAEVSRPPGNPREAVAFFQDLLQRQLARLQHQTAGLSLDEAHDTVMLHRRLPLDTLDIQGLEAALEDYLNQLEYWRGAAEPTPAALPPGAMRMFFP